MAKKKAPSEKQTEPKNNCKRIIAVGHREIKRTGRKFDNGFIELRVWLPLWELPIWVAAQPGESPEYPGLSDLIKQLLLEKLAGGKSNG